MALFTLETEKRIKPTEKEYSYIMISMCTMVAGQTIRLMDMVSIPIRMALLTRGTGKMTSSMGRE